MELTIFRNNRIQIGENIPREESLLGLLIRTYIDGYTSDGKYTAVIATVSTTIHGDTVIDRRIELFDKNDTVNKLINEAIAKNKALIKRFEQEMSVRR